MRRATRSSALLRALLVVLAGLALVLAFPPHGLWWFAPLSVAAFTAAVRGRSWRSGAGLGYLYGAAFFGPLLHWSGIYVGPVPWLLLAGAEACFLLVLGALLALATRVPGWPVWTAALWVAEEAARDRIPFGGFPWGRLAFSQPESPFVGIAAVGGAPLVTFAVALCGGLLAYAVLRAVRRSWALSPLAAAAAALVAAAGLAVPTGAPASSHSVTAAVVQGNVPRLGLDFNAQREAVLRNHVDRTFELAAKVRAGELPQPDLVIWPENSSDIDPFENADAAALISSAVDAIGVPVLVGAVVDGPGRYRSNEGIVWTPGSGPGQRYTKRHPVPFGEYIPLRSIARLVSSKVDLVQRDFIGGDKPGVLRLGSTRVGDVICFEVAYDGLVRDVVTGGGQLLVVQTNNATFGRTGETYQQMAMSQLRAVEHGRTVLVAATSGLSAIIAPDGRIVDRSAIFTPDLLVASVPLSDATTIATRIGALPEWLLTGIGLLAAAGGALLSRDGRRRRR